MPVPLTLVAEFPKSVLLTRVTVPEKFIIPPLLPAELLVTVLDRTVRSLRLRKKGASARRVSPTVRGSAKRVLPGQELCRQNPSDWARLLFDVKLQLFLFAAVGMSPLRP